MAEFQLATCTPTDLDDMVSIYIAAFRPSNMYQILFPSQSCSTDAVRTWLHARFKKALALPNQGPAVPKHFKVTEVATGRMAAWLKWGNPFVLTEEERARMDAENALEEKLNDKERVSGRSTRWPEGANDGVCTSYFGALKAMREKHMKWDEDYICFLLATDPDFQRRGLGGMLLGHVISLAEADGKKVYLEATIAGHSLYTKLGRRDVDLITVDLRHWGVDLRSCNWIMLREPLTRE